LELTTHPI